MYDSHGFHFEKLRLGQSQPVWRLLTSPCVDGRAYNLDAVVDTMLGVQGGKVRPCVLWKVGKELVVLISWLGNGAEVERRGTCFTKQRRKICFGVHKSFSSQVH